MTHFFNRITEQFSNGLPFVIYRKPNSTEIKAFLQKNKSLYYTKDFEETGFVFSPFDDRLNSVLIPLEHSEIVSVNTIAPTTSLSYNGNSWPIVNLEKQAHIHLVEKGVSAIKNGAMEKVVLSRKETVHLENNDIFLIYQKLLASYTSAFVYCWYHPKVGLWLGATPETLLKIEGRNFSMMALAGTQNYNGALNVNWQNKEIKEQQFVTDFILDQIKSTVEHIKVSEVETVKAGNLLHLRTLIKGYLNPENYNLRQLLYNLHPTPAVCGLPKEAAKSFILENENYSREFYTGFLGELNFQTSIKPRTGKRNIENRAYTAIKKSTQLYVNLRCMQVKDNSAFIYVGGGITATSNPESEWEETVSKSKVVKKVL